ncbi:MAG: polyprenyl diphosphate synthase, partial [Lachnospiraceae bacterium]|nr:polyprenyl diphosphate synthase [Lachnospiraceae bacterium]
VYAFSTENWKRPQAEVDTLMELFRDYMKTAAKRANKNNMRVIFLGDKQGLPEDLREKALEVEADTADNDGLTFCVAINYGSRDEILRAAKTIAAHVASGELTVDEINETLFSACLDTKGIPDPDLLIRTSGEERLSNYLLWQLAYTEFYFTSVHWPDFKEKQLDEAIASYQNRKRKFGKVEEV